MKPPFLQLGITANRSPAGAIKFRQQGTFRRGHGTGLRVLNGRKQLPQLMVTLTYRHAHDALPGGRKHHLGGERHVDAVFHAEAFQPCISQQRRIALSCPQLVQPGLHITPQQGEAKVRPDMKHLRLTADRRTAHECSFRQTVERPFRINRHAPFAQHQHITGILTLHRAGQHQSRRQVGLKVLEAVDGKIDPAHGQKFMNLFGEQPLPTDLGQTVLEVQVPGGLHLLFLEGPHVPQNGTETGQAGQEVPRLHQCQRGRPCPDPQGKFAPVRWSLRMGAASRFGSNFLKCCGGKV